MNTGRYVLGSFVVFVYFFLAEWLFNGLIMADSYAEYSVYLRLEADMQTYFPFMLLGFLVLAFGFCFVFLKGYQGKGCVEGIRYGLYVAIAFGVSTHLINYAVFPHPGIWVISWIIGYPIILMGGGAVFAAIYKPKPPSVS